MEKYNELLKDGIYDIDTLVSYAAYYLHVRPDQIYVRYRDFSFLGGTALSNGNPLDGRPYRNVYFHLFSVYMGMSATSGISLRLGDARRCTVQFNIPSNVHFFFDNIFVVNAIQNPNTDLSVEYLEFSIIS